MNGKRTKLIDKRHFIHQDNAPFWEAFEDYLITTHDYDPTKHELVINGDGASWITSCRDYLGKNVTFVIDRFHVAREVRRSEEHTSELQSRGHLVCRLLLEKKN